MTVIKCTEPYGCGRTFVTTRTLKQHAQASCPFCGHEGGVIIHEKGSSKERGYYELPQRRICYEGNRRFLYLY